MSSIGAGPAGRYTDSRYEWPQIFLYLLVVLSVFESDRSNMVLSGFISRIKDIDIALFFASIAVLFRAKFKIDFFTRNAYGWLLIYVALSLPISIYSQFTHYGAPIQAETSFAWAFYLRMIYFCLLMLVLPMYFSQYPEDGARTARLLVISCVIFVLFNTVAYFYQFPFMTSFRPYPGRISNGYPTSDALMLSFAFVALVLGASKFSLRHYVAAGILLVGTIANLTASGALCLLGLGLLYVALNFLRSPGKVILIIGGASGILGIASYVAYLALSYYSPLDLDKTVYVLTARLTAVQDPTGAGNTFTFRLKEFTDIFQFMETPFDWIFGIGCHYGSVEIQYGHMFIVWGVIGFVLFLFTLIQNLLTSLPENLEGSLYFNLVWWISGMVLITTYLFPLFVPFAILVCASGNGVFDRQFGNRKHLWKASMHSNSGDIQMERGR